MGTPSRWVEPYREEHSKIIETGYERAIEWEKVEPEFAYTALCQGESGETSGLVVGGVSPLWPGVGQIWVIFGVNALEHRFFVHKMCIKYLDVLAKKHKFWRIQATIPCLSHANLSWAESFGFELESEMKSFGPLREDHFMYRKLYV